MPTYRSRTIVVFNCVVVVVFFLQVFDSTELQGELNWDKQEFGDSSELPGWKEQSYSFSSSNAGAMQQSSSNGVTRIYFVCDIASSNPNNWLRLPFIGRQAANRLTVRIDYTIRECKRYPGEIRSCKETFQMFYAEAADAGVPPPAFAETNYKYVRTIASNKKQQQQQQLRNLSSDVSQDIYRIEVDLPLSPSEPRHNDNDDDDVVNSGGVYIVFRDQGACVSLLAIRVYYTLCAAQLTQLAIYPQTATGANVTDLVPRTGKCVANADVAVDNGARRPPLAYCQTNGNWFVPTSGAGNGPDTDAAAACVCSPGYFYSPLGGGSLQCQGIFCICVCVCFVTSGRREEGVAGWVGR